MADQQERKTLIQSTPTERQRDQETEFHQNLSMSPHTVQQEDMDWSALAKPVKSSAWSIVSAIVVDLILFTLSLGFLGFALIVNHYNEALTADHHHATTRLLDAAKYGPSAFPILFAAVTGRAIQAVLLWRLERGERIGVLDLLAGSTSFTSTIMSQFNLRFVSPLGVFLVALWALSPIGGQASIRQITLGNRTNTGVESFDYFVPSGGTGLYADPISSYWLTIANPLFLASMMASAVTKASPRDTWNNVKIPRIEYYEHASFPDDDGWFVADANDNAMSYSSLIGAPLQSTTDRNTQRAVTYNLTMEAMYLRLNCPVVNDPHISNSTIYRNASIPGTASLYWLEGVDDKRALLEPWNQTQPFNFTYSSSYLGSSQCEITNSYVEVQVFCPTPITCAASRLRRSVLKNPPAAYTQLDMWNFGPSNWLIFSTNFMSVFSSRPGGTGRSSLLDNYVLTPEDPVMVKDFAVNENMFPVRMGQLFNAYWTCLQGLQFLTSGSNDKILSNATVTGSTSWQTEVIVAHKGWVATLCFASIVMIVASLAYPVVRYFLTRGPDLMLNISSLAVRDNAYTPLLCNASYMPASDRSRKLKNYKVQFGDVEGDAAVGKLAISRVDDKNSSCVIERVRKGRLYR